jgi:hypothetical protein
MYVIMLKGWHTGLTVLIIVDLVAHGEKADVLVHPVLHAVHQVLVWLEDLLLQQLEVRHALLEVVPVRAAFSVVQRPNRGDL